MNEMVKYHNDLNSISMRAWTTEEQNFFFAIIAKLRDNGTKELKFDKRTLAELARYSVRTNKSFRDTMESLANKSMNIKYTERSSNSLKVMALFESFEVEWTDDLSEMSAIIKVTDKFAYIVNKLDIEFTSFLLDEFTSISSTYSKSMFRLLKQWRVTGEVAFTIEVLRKRLTIPKSYGISHIDNRVIAPIEKELPQYFKDLKVKKIKSNTKGNPVLGYKFTFKSEKTGTWINNKLNFPSINFQTLPE